MGHHTTTVVVGDKVDDVAVAVFLLLLSERAKTMVTGSKWPPGAKRKKESRLVNPKTGRLVPACQLDLLETGG